MNYRTSKTEIFTTYVTRQSLCTVIPVFLKWTIFNSTEIVELNEGAPVSKRPGGGGGR